MKTRRIYSAGSVALTITALFIVANLAQNNGAGSNALVGSWKVRLTPVNPPQPQFDEMMTFTPGGGIVESNNYPFFQMGLTAGPGQGTWEYSGNRGFKFTFIKFLYTQGGAAAGTLKAAGEIDYSQTADTWSGPATVSICNSQAENCTVIGTTNGQATRITAAE